MLDRENVIEGIEAIREFFGFGLPSQSPVFEAYQNILTDALALIDTQYKLILELQNLISIGTKMMNGDKAICERCQEFVCDYCPYADN